MDTSFRHLCCKSLELWPRVPLPLNFCFAGYLVGVAAVSSGYVVDVRAVELRTAYS